MKEMRVLYSDQLRGLCIANGWYTFGDYNEYFNMLKMCGDGTKNITTDDIVAIATNIMNRSRDSDERELESYCYEIAEITHTFFRKE